MPALRPKLNNPDHFNYNIYDNINRKKQQKYAHKNIYKTQRTPFSKDANKTIAMTYDQGTQTGPRFAQIGVATLPKMEEKVAMLEQVIDEVEEKFSILEATIESWFTGAEHSGPESPGTAVDMTLREIHINTSRNEQPIKTPPIKRRESSPEERSENEEVDYNDMVCDYDYSDMLKYIINTLSHGMKIFDLKSH